MGFWVCHVAMQPWRRRRRRRLARPAHHTRTRKAGLSPALSFVASTGYSRPMRRRPHWLAKRRPGIPEPGKAPPSAMLARRSSFGDFTPGNGRTQCGAIAKSTGLRCRKDAIGGTARCEAHKGIAAAMAKARARGERLVRATRNYPARAMLYVAGLDEPEGFRSDAKGVERGRLVEAFKNAQALKIVTEK